MAIRNRKALRLIKGKEPIIVDQSEKDKNIIDQVIKTLYQNSDKVTMNLENDIYRSLKIKLPIKESSRLREVMISAGLITPVIGFGNVGKVELTRAGYQLMAQFGGYKEYLISLQSNQGPQTVILPIQVEGDDSSAPEQPDQPVKVQPPMKKTGKKNKRH